MAGLLEQFIVVGFDRDRQAGITDAGCSASTADPVMGGFYNLRGEAVGVPSH